MTGLTQLRVLFLGGGGGFQKIENVAFPSSGERQRHDALHRDDMFSSAIKKLFTKNSHIDET